MPASGVDVLHTGAHSVSLGIADFHSTGNPYFPTLEMFDELAFDLRKLLTRQPSESASVTARLAGVLGLQPQTLAIGNGTAELITWIDQLLIKSSVAVPIPTFSRWTDQPMETGKRVDMFPLRERDGFQLDLDEYVQFIRERGSRVAVVSNVNNPDGGYLNHRDVLRFLDDLADLDLVVIDESSIDFSDVEQYPSVGAEAVIRSNVVVLKSLDENFGLHGLRLGYLMANPAIAGKIARALPKGNVNALAERVVAMMEDHQDDYAESLRLLSRDRRSMAAELSRLDDLKVFPSQGNFILVKLQPEWSGVELRDYLAADHAVYTRECGSRLGITSQFMRLAVRPAADVDRLIDGIEDYGDKLRAESANEPWSTTGPSWSSSSSAPMSPAPMSPAPMSPAPRSPAPRSPAPMSSAPMSPASWSRTTTGERPRPAAGPAHAAPPEPRPERASNSSRSADRPRARPVDEPQSWPVDEPRSRPVDEPQSRPVDEPQSRPVDEPRADSWPGERSGSRDAPRTGSWSADRPLEDPWADQRPPAFRPATRPADDQAGPPRPADRGPDESRSSDGPRTGSWSTTGPSTDPRPANRAHEMRADPEGAPADYQPAERRPADSWPAEQPPADYRPAKRPPADTWPAEQPRSDSRPAEQPRSDSRPAEQPRSDHRLAKRPPADSWPAEQPPADYRPAKRPSADSWPAERPSSDPWSAEPLPSDQWPTERLSLDPWSEDPRPSTGRLDGPPQYSSAANRSGSRPPAHADDYADERPAGSGYDWRRRMAENQSENLTPRRTPGY